MCREAPGAVTEWPKVHDWKSCVLKGTEGSNPSRSADDIVDDAHDLRDQFYGPG